MHIIFYCTSKMLHQVTPAITLYNFIRHTKIVLCSGHSGHSNRWRSLVADHSSLFVGCFGLLWFCSVNLLSHFMFVITVYGDATTLVDGCACPVSMTYKWSYVCTPWFVGKPHLLVWIEFQTTRAHRNQCFHSCKMCNKTNDIITSLIIYYLREWSSE